MATLDLSKPFTVEEDVSTGLDLSKSFTVEEDQKESSVLDTSKPFAVEATSDKTTETDEGVAQEFFEGIGSGLIAIPQGILELGAAGVDLVADTD